MKTVVTTGVFDLLHAGHVRLLEFAKNGIEKDCRLVVLVDSDTRVRAAKGPTRPINSLYHRLIVLDSVRYVDTIIPFASDASKEKIIRFLKPDFFVKGGDYSIDKILEKDLIESLGGKVVIFPHQFGISTTKILKRATE